MIENFTPIGTKPFWAQPIIPLAYSDAITYLEQMRALTDKLNVVISNLGLTADEVIKNQNGIKDINQQISIVNKTLEDITNGNYMDEYQEGLGKWIDDNLQQLVSRIAKFVVFGLTDDGYFAAYIPPNWDFLHFDTIMDYSSDLYGHLILRW